MATQELCRREIERLHDSFVRFYTGRRGDINPVEDALAADFELVTETEVTVCRYEEWQTTPDGENGRVSTVVFRVDADTPGGLSWVNVHETWC